jgi:glycosyltransferase involved in cell wall biosynthesis
MFIMDIVVVNNLYAPNIVGGAEKSVQILSEEFVREGHSVTVLTLACKPTQAVEIVNGVKVYYLRPLSFKLVPTNKRRSIISRFMFQLSAGMFDWYVLHQVSNILNTIHVDVVFINNLAGMSYSIPNLPILNSKPIIHTLRDYHLLCMRQSMFDGKNVCNKQCKLCSLFTRKRKQYSNIITCVIGNSEYILKKHLAEGYFSNSCVKTVVYSGYKDNSIKQRSRERHGSVFGFIGQISIEKGVEHMLESFSQVENPTARLLIAGTGRDKYLRYLRHKYSDPRVEWKGWMMTSDFFENIDYLILPSIWPEPLPRVVYESYVYGIPVIVSNRGGTQEIVVNDLTGWVYDPSNKTQLTENIKKCLSLEDTKYNKMVEECLKFAIQFDPEDIARKYLSIFKQSLSGVITSGKA